MYIYVDTQRSLIATARELDPRLLLFVVFFFRRKFSPRDI